MMEPYGSKAVDHSGLFGGFHTNTVLDYKGEGARYKLRSSLSRQHDLHHHVSVENSSQV